MSNEELLNTVNSLTNTYYAALGFVATVILGILAFVFWDRVNFKKSLEKEFKIILKEELKNQKFEIDYYYLNHLPFIRKLETHYKGMGIEKEGMLRFILKYCDKPLNEMIALYNHCVNTSFQPFFESYLRDYYDICYKIIEDAREFATYRLDTLTEMELNALVKVNTYIPQLNYIFTKYDYLEFKAIVLDKTN